MDKKDYNRTNALVYELILFLQRFSNFFKTNFWIKKILENCFEDWCEFRTQILMADLDKQTEALHDAWDLEEADLQKPIYTELPPDNSEAQALLGGEMRLSAPWTVDKNEPSD